MRPCPSCGFANAETAKFCSECGAALATAPRTAREERKVVTVVFVDLVGSTAIAESSDPEDVRALLRVYHEGARDALERFGGTVEKFIGDAVVAVFGAPVAHEDDPERAVRAALAVREAIAALNDEAAGRDLHVRIAVNTGEALVSLEAAPNEGEAMVAGDVINTAARLQTGAPVDGILVGEQTYRATEREIEYREARAVEAKGKAEPIAAYEAVEARARLGVDLGGAGRAELVGRVTELDLLVDALRRARRDRSTQLVTLVGVPGIGKSRLVLELGRIVDDDPDLIVWRQGRSLPYGQGVTYWALGEIVKAQAGILESDPADTAEAKLADAVGMLSDTSERSWVARHLRPLVGLGGDEVGSGDRRGEAFAAWRRFLEAIAEGGPTVLVFEDLHWADDGLLDFVDGLVDWVDGVPLLVVATARPELLDRRQGWGGGKRNTTTVSLAPLGDDDTVALIHALLDRPLLAADEQRALVERAAGNPLYAEEFVRMLQAGTSITGGLPETVQGIVTARIDLLPAGEKDLLQHASVLGKVFWTDALASLTGTEPWRLTESLRSLERKEFVRREHRSAVAGAAQYAFVHALVRDAAYGGLPRQVRADRHLAAATWIESLPDDRAEDRAETLAHHFLIAIELLRASGQDAAEIGARAIEALQEAGERSLALNAYHAAARFLSHAIDLLPTGREPSPELLFAAGRAFGFIGREGDELERAVAGFEAVGDYERAAEAAVEAAHQAWYGGSADARRMLERAASLLEGKPRSRAEALVLAERARQAMVEYRFQTAMELAEAAAAIAKEIDDDELRADALVTLGSCQANAGDRRGTETIENAIALVGGRGRVAGRGFNNLASALESFGEIAAALEVVETSLKQSAAEGDDQRLWFQRGNLARLHYSVGAWDEALALSEAFLEEAPESTRYLEPIAHEVRARILDARDQPEAAWAEILQAVERARQVEDAQSLLPELVIYARLARRRGFDDAWRRAIDEVVAALEATEAASDQGDWHAELVLELVEGGRQTDADGLVERIPEGTWRDACRTLAEGDYDTAAEMIADLGAEPLAADVRLLAAQSLAAAGRVTEASQQVERARSFFQHVGATAYMRESDEILAAAS